MSKTAAQLVEEGDALANAGKKQEAIRLYDQAIAVDPNFGEAYYSKADAMGIKKEDYEQKVVLYEKALELGYAHSWTYNNYGNALMALGRIDETIKTYLKLIEIDTEKQFLLSLIGLLYEQMENRTEALKCYDLCFEKNVAVDLASLYKGKWLAREGKFEEALKNLERCLVDRPNDVETHFQIGNVHRALKQEDKAITHFKKAIAQTPDNPNDWCHRGLAFIALGKREEGLSDLKKTRSELETYTQVVYNPAYINFMKATITSIVEAEELGEKSKEVEKKLEQNPAAQKFKSVLKKLQVDKENMQNKLIGQLSQQQSSEGNKNIDEFNKLKEEFNKQLLEMQAAFKQEINEVKKDVTTKTAAQLVAEGDALANAGKKQEAIPFYDQAIAVDPKFGEAYYSKGDALGIKKEDYEQKAVLYEKALELGYAHSWTYNNYGNALMALGRTDETIKIYLKLIEIDTEKQHLLSLVGLLYEQVENRTEALKCYDLCFEKNVAVDLASLYKGKWLAQEGKFEEALKNLERCLVDRSNDIETLFQIGNVYRALKQEDKAITHYKKAVAETPDNPNDWYNRGLAFIALGKREEGLSDLKRTWSEIETYTKITYNPAYINFMKATITSIVEAEELGEKSKEVEKKLEQNPAAQKFKSVLKKLQDDKENMQNKLIGQLSQQQSSEGNKNIDEFNKLKEEFNKQLLEMQAALKQEIGEVKKDVTKLDTKVKAIENNMEILKEEINNKLDDFSKKLNTELDKQDLSPEDKAKLNGYFKAFIGTISSIHVTSQVVDSGQVQIDAGSNTTTILSAIASFAPFIGSTLSSGITSIGEFFNTKEIKTNARKVKGLAPDATGLSQLLGKSTYEILMNKTKQQQVINITDQDLRKSSANLFQKVFDLCERLNAKIDTFLYTGLYQTPAERLAHQDANSLIEKWLKGTIAPFNIQEQFVDEVLNPDNSAVKENTNPLPPKETNRSACCTMF